MQTLREVFWREDERLNLVNTAICIALVVLLVVVVFGLGELRLAVQNNPSEKPVPTATPPASDDAK